VLARKLTEAGVPVERLNVATEQGKQIAATYRISQVPAVVLLDDHLTACCSWNKLPEAAEVLEEVEAAGNA
jgi:hypothetical protein